MSYRDSCPKCFNLWDLHEFAVPEPYCPAPRQTPEQDLETLAQASLASLYTMMDPSVLPHVKKRIDDYINHLKQRAAPPPPTIGHFLPEDATQFDHLHAIRAVVARSPQWTSSRDNTILGQIFTLADAGMNVPTDKANN